ncbi:hypothetical protein [Paenibacillus sp. IHBB 3054]|uniref:hypothetical protein n=1 Tax=Paenibacillus sp. IHBB 3054 TaxID=3425689 RepID=UPI003F67DA75
MGFRNRKSIQIVIVLLYPLIIFGLLCMSQTLDSWFVPVIVTLLFSLLWANLRYLMISTILMWTTAVPAWWLLIERTREGQGAAIFSASLPFVILLFLFLVLIPEMLIVSIGNVLVKKASVSQS